MTSCMPLVIHPADLEADRERLIELFSHCLNPDYNGTRFDWLYKRNPHGQAVAWVAEDPEQQRLVGAAAAFPRRLYMNEMEKFAWLLGDFCLSESYRSVGPALQLQRQCLAAVDAGNAFLCYDFPSARMMAIYHRLGLRPTGQMLRLAKPLRVDRKVRALLKTRAFSGGLSAVGNSILRLQDWRPRTYGAATITVHHGECGQEFSLLAHKVGGRYGACIQRSAEYLNWRYITNPLYRCEFLTAHREHALLGYAVFSHQGEDATLLDLFGVPDFTIPQDLVHAVAEVLRSRGVVTLSASMLDSHPWLSVLRQCGFTAREASPVMIYASRHSAFRHGGVDGQHWSFMHGDRDG